MCGFVGIVNFKENISNSYSLIRNMNMTLRKRGPDEDGLYFSNHCIMGHSRLSIIDLENGKQPMSFKYNDNLYTICYNGQIYNSNELKEELKNYGIGMKTHSDTEVLIKAYCVFKEGLFEKLNGIFSFAIWNQDKGEIIIARDHFGIKPLYFYFNNKELIFASEIKAILEFDDMPRIIDLDGIKELIGIGPCHSPGLTPFKNIREVKPATYIKFNSNEFYEKEYWKLKTKLHTDNLEETKEKIKFLVKDSIKRQVVSDVEIGTLLSGGLDSSIITKYTSDIYKEKYGKRLKTFSVDYIDQDKNFVKTDFTPSQDNKYIDIMVDYLDTDHTKILLDSKDLANSLNDAMIARDMPGMADVDSSYLLFFKEVRKHVKVALSGECSDEIFGGYPWYFREDSLNSNTFPWSLAIEERQKLLNENISRKVDLKKYINRKYEESVSKVQYLNFESDENKVSRKMIYLTTNWFMQTLLDRTDRMCMYNGLEVRVPFCDVRIVEYLWNVPWHMKAYDNREKGLLRLCFENELPDEIIFRKKSPYPKTHNPIYLEIVKNKLKEIYDNKDSKIFNILNKNYIKDIIDTDGNNFKRPWFGQLMTGPQLMAYIIQFELWLERYDPYILID